MADKDAPSPRQMDRISSPDSSSPGSEGHSDGANTLSAELRNTTIATNNNRNMGRPLYRSVMDGPAPSPVGSTWSDFSNPRAPVARDASRDTTVSLQTPNTSSTRAQASQNNSVSPTRSRRTNNSALSGSGVGRPSSSRAQAAATGRDSAAALDRVASGRITRPTTPPLLPNGRPQAGNCRWSSEQNQMLREGRAAGRTHAAIGMQLGKTALACRLKWFQMSRKDKAEEGQELTQTSQRPAPRNRNPRDLDGVRMFGAGRDLLPAPSTTPSRVNDFRSYPATNSMADARRSSGIAPHEDTGIEARARNFILTTAREMNLPPAQVQRMLMASQGGDDLFPAAAMQSQDRAGPSSRPVTYGRISQSETDAAVSLAQMARTGSSSSSSSSSGPVTPTGPGFGSLASRPADAYYSERRPMAMRPTPYAEVSHADEESQRRRDTIRASMSFNNVLNPERRS